MYATYVLVLLFSSQAFCWTSINLNRHLVAKEKELFLVITFFFSLLNKNEKVTLFELLALLKTVQ